MIISVVAETSLCGLERSRAAGTMGDWWRSAYTDFEGGMGLYMGFSEMTASGRKMEFPSRAWVVM